MCRCSGSVGVGILRHRIGIPGRILVKVSPSFIQMMRLRLSFARRSILRAFHLRRRSCVSRGLIVGDTGDNAGVGLERVTSAVTVRLRVIRVAVADDGYGAAVRVS